jgi:hypothetical protein
MGKIGIQRLLQCPEEEGNMYQMKNHNKEEKKKERKEREERLFQNCTFPAY